MMTKALSITALTLCGAALLYAPASALPTFAQAYGVKCSVCHSTVPQLNAYGRYVQRTGYSALSRDLLKNYVPVTVSQEVTTDTSSGSGQIEPGNTAFHAAGYLSPDITYHIHQWLVDDGQPGGLDTMQLAYSNFFRNSSHFFVGKISALPVPGPFSNQSDLAPYQSAEMQVGEHMYQFDMMRWGAGYSYVQPKFYAEIAWQGSSLNWNGATQFTNTDKTFQWIAAYASAGDPFETGAYGSIGSYPLSQGGFDNYDTIALYAQRDPGPHYVPGLFALYQWGYDANPGSVGMGGAGSMVAPLVAMTPSPMPSTMPPPPPMTMLPPAHSRALTLELYEPLFKDIATVGLRHELTNDGLGNIVDTGDIDLYVTPFKRYDYIHLYFESALQQNAGPTWATKVWWAFPIASPLRAP